MDSWARVMCTTDLEFADCCQEAQGSGEGARGAGAEQGLSRGLPGLLGDSPSEPLEVQDFWGILVLQGGAASWGV